MVFWILTALMVIVAMGFVCMPMLRSTVSARSEIDSEQTLYSARIAEIEKDIELGRLDAKSADAAKAEEARRLIKATESSQTISQTSTHKILIICAAICLPLISLPLYVSLGSPNVATLSQVAQQNTTPVKMTELLEIAEKRLSENPDDTNGWKVVAPVYMRQQRYADAINAYENIMRVEGRSPEFIIKLTDVYIEEKQGQIDDRAKALIAEVLSIENDNPIATFYTGIIELQSNNEDETRRIWQGMVDNAKGNEDWLPVVKSRIAELNRLQLRNPLPAVDNDTLQAVQNLTPEARTQMINQMVSNLDAKLRENPDDKIGWERLITVYMVLGKKEEALGAFNRASEQFSDDQNFVALLKELTLKNNKPEGED